jgi:hypothetical protein
MLGINGFLYRDTEQPTHDEVNAIRRIVLPEQDVSPRDGNPSYRIRNRLDPFVTHERGPELAH